MLSNLYSEYNTAANCTPVSPVPHGIPQYDHAGCITGYVVKNSKDGVKTSGMNFYSGPTTTESGSEIFDHMGNVTGYLQGAGDERMLMSGHGLQGSVQYYGAGSVSAHNMGIPTYDAKGKLSGAMVGVATDSEMYTPEGLTMAEGYKAMADSEGNVIGFYNEGNSVVDNRQYDYYMRNEGIKEGLMAAKASMDATYYKDAKTNFYYKIPVGAIHVVNSKGDFVGYRTDEGLTNVEGLKGLTQAEYNNIGVEEGMKAAQTSMDATHVSSGGKTFTIPTGAYVMHNSAGKFVGYKMAGGEMVSAATMAAATSGQHSYYNKVVKSDGAVKITPQNIGVIAGQQAMKTSEDETYVMHAGHKFVIPAGCTAMYNSLDAFTGYMNSKGVMTNIGVLMAKAGINAAQVGINAGNIGVEEGMKAAQTSMNATYVMYNGQRFVVPVGAKIYYTSNNQFAGYKMIGGETITVDTLMKSATGMHSYYDKKAVATKATKATVTKAAPAKMYIEAKNCTPVSPVADGIPQYDHHGCITGYVVKDSSDGLKNTYVVDNGITYNVPAGSTEAYDAAYNFIGYNLPDGDMISIDEIKASQTAAMHSYYDKATKAVAKKAVVAKKMYIEAKGCTPVSPVADGIPEYNHEGCITGYVVKNSTDVNKLHDTYIEANGQTYNVPAGATEAYDAGYNFIGYNLPNGDMITTEEIKAAQVATMHSYYDKDVVVATPAQKAVAIAAKVYIEAQGCTPVSPVANGIPQYNHAGCITGYVVKNSDGVNKLHNTNVEYEGITYNIPAGATEAYGAGYDFLGYNLPNGEMITADEIEASQTASEHSYYDKKVTQVGKIAGKTGVIAGKIGMKAGNIGVKAGAIGMKAGNIGVKAGAMAAKVSMKDTYVHFMGEKFAIPAGAQVMWSAGQFAGYKMGKNIITLDTLMTAQAKNGMHSYYNKKVDNSDVTKVVHDEADNCTPVSPVADGIPQYNHAGCITGYVVKNSESKDSYVQYEGHTFMVPAGATEAYDGKYNFVGYTLATGEMVSTEEMMAAATQATHTYYDKEATHIGQKEGAMAAKLSMDETYYHYNGMYFKLPPHAVITYSSEGDFMGYTHAGEQVLVSQMTGIDQAQFTALHIGKYEGVQAAMTSMKENGVGVAAGKVGVIKANVGIKDGNIGMKAGLAAAATSIKDSYVKYNGHVFKVPTGAVEQYDASNQFAGYVMAGGESISAAEMMSAAQQTGGYYDEEVGKVGMNAGINAGNIGMKAGLAAAATSMEDSYVHYGGHVFQVPAGAVENYDAANVFTGYTLKSGQNIDIDQMMKAAQYSQIGIVEGQAAAAESMAATHVHFNGMYYALPTGAHATYDDAGIFTGYFSAEMISGGIPVYNVLAGVRTLSGYHFPVSMLKGTKTAVASAVVKTAAVPAHNAKGCNPVSPVPHGKPEYNHEGCITGYVVKNSSNLMMLI